MDDEAPKKYSFPNVGSKIPGVIDKNTEEQPAPTEKPVVHILDALSGVKKDDNDTRTIRTYQEDITDAIRNDNVSMIKMALAEKKRQERQGSYDQVVDEQSGSKKFLIFSLVGGALILIVIAVILLRPKPAVNPSAPSIDQGQNIIYTEASVARGVDGRDPEDTERVVKDERDTKLDFGSMKEIVLTTGQGTSTRRITSEEFFRAIQARIPDGLTRSIDPGFLLGVYSFTPHDLFAVFKVNSYDLAFATMLQWEPDMEADIGTMFISRESAVSPSDITSTTSKPAFLNNRVFTDKVIDNKDSRVLLNQDGTIAMMYTFLDKNTLVIASSDKAIKELTYRLTTGRVAR